MCSAVECCPAVKEDHNAPRGRRTFYEAISNRAEAADGKEKIKRQAVKRFSTDGDVSCCRCRSRGGENLRESPRNSSNRSFHSWIMGRVVYYCSLVCLVLDGAGERRCLMRINPRPAPMGSESRVAGLIIPRHHLSAAEHSLCTHRRHCPPLPPLHRDAVLCQGRKTAILLRRPNQPSGGELNTRCIFQRLMSQMPTIPGTRHNRRRKQVEIEMSSRTRRIACR